MSGLALLMAGSGAVPRYCAIGSGSGAEVVTLGSLIAEVLSARVDYTSRSIATAKQVNWVYDFGSTVMSGTNLREFGVGQSATKATNDLWARQAFTSITFDGSNELQVDISFIIF